MKVNYIKLVQLILLQLSISYLNLISCESATNDLTNVEKSNEKSNDLIINRIDLPEDKVSKLFTIAHLNDTHENLSVKWLGKGSSVMIILAKNNKAKANATKPTNMYISYDYGSTFTKEERLKLNDGSPAILNTFITSKVNNSHFIFTDIVNSYVFISDDYGRSYESVKLEFSPKIVQMHPSISSYILASDDTETSKLYLSKDFGRKWINIHDNVTKFGWATFENLHRLYVLYGEKDGQKKLKLTDDYFETHQVHRNGVKDFKTCNNYITYVGTRTNLGGTRDQYSTMWVGFNGSDFNFALFNNRSQMDAEDYIVSDCTDNELIVAVKFKNLNNYHLLISNQKGNRFRKVLDNIVVTQVANKSTVDIHKVAGLTGIYIANAYENKSSSVIVSMITYDSGFSWNKINLTQVQSDELVNSKCKSETCSLHFLQNSQLTHSLKYSGIISKESAVGVILANGIIDEHLKNDTKSKQVPQYYISRDAGENWRKVADGKYLFNIADHGGLIVGVKHFSKSTTSTKTLIYSLDDGKTFKELQFINESMRVYSLLTENGEKTSVFTIFGSMENASHSWTLVKVNLTTLYNRVCDKNDFEFWRPHSKPNTKCTMGVQLKLLRRKENVNCSHGEEFERKNTPILCDCQLDDYVCDYGFQETENKTCVAIDLDEFFPACDEKNSVRTVIGGYMRIPGNRCLPVEGSPYENTRQFKCTTKTDRQVFKTFFISLLLTIIVFAAGYLGINYFRNRQTRGTLLNTHYNRRTDSAILLDDDGLGNEEVYVRGFSDDVPMVIS